MIWHYEFRYQGTGTNGLLEGMVIDPISKLVMIKYPISEANFLRNLESGMLEYLPLNIELREEANYTANIEFSVESDALGAPGKNEYNGKKNLIQFNITFYTFNITADYYTIITFHQRTTEEDIPIDDEYVDEDLF